MDELETLLDRSLLYGELLPALPVGYMWHRKTPGTWTYDKEVEVFVGSRNETLLIYNVYTHFFKDGRVSVRWWGRDRPQKQERWTSLQDPRCSELLRAYLDEALRSH